MPLVKVEFSLPVKKLDTGDAIHFHFKHVWRQAKSWFSFHLVFFGLGLNVFVYLYFVQVDARICVVSVFSFVFRAARCQFSRFALPTFIINLITIPYDHECRGDDFKTVYFSWAWIWHCLPSILRFSFFSSSSLQVEISGLCDSITDSN